MRSSANLRDEVLHTYRISGKIHSKSISIKITFIAILCIFLDVRTIFKVVLRRVLSFKVFMLIASFSFGNFLLSLSTRCDGICS